MKIKSKFLVWISILLLALGIVINILIKQALVLNMESTVNNSLKEVMNTSREYIKYRLIINSVDDEDVTLQEQSQSIMSYILINYQGESQVSNMNGEKLAGNISDNLDEVINTSIVKAKEGQVIRNIEYSGNNLSGIITYPIYIDNTYLGIITVSKDYDELFATHNETMRFTTFMEIVLFSGIFFTLYLVIGKLTRPIVELTEGVKAVGDGNYDVDISIKSDDEIGVLASEFVKMKSKIQAQIEDIQYRNDKVQKLELSRREFFNNVTHELKTPLTAITGYSDMLMNDMIADPQFKDRAINRIHSESERLHKLVIDLIATSKGLSSNEESFTLVDIAGIINEICDDMSMKAGKYSLTINKDIESCKVEVQINRIKSVIVNLIDNAIKYIKNDDIVYVQGLVTEESYKIIVSNKSDPIPESIYNNIFEPFIKQSNDDSGLSRGLGLYICKEIITEHNAKISIENGQEVKVTIEFLKD